MLLVEEWGEQVWESVASVLSSQRRALEEGVQSTRVVRTSICKDYVIGFSIQRLNSAVFSSFSTSVFPKTSFFQSATMQCCGFVLLLFSILFCGFGNGQSLDIFLINITIFERHEAQLPFTTNHPEVYLSCDDGRPKVNLDQVRRINQLYAYRVGDIIATNIESGGCVDCTLKEDDPTPTLQDDTFGSWTMCQANFEETGFYQAQHPGEFVIDFACPDCQRQLLPEIVEPAPEPFLEEAPPSSEPMIDDEDLSEIVPEDEREDAITGYYSITDGTTSPSPEETSEVLLQSEEGGDQESGAPVNNSAPSGSSSGGMTVMTVLLLCFAFLVVGIAIGVGILWKVSLAKHENSPVYEAIELAKSGFLMEKANGKL